MGRFDISFKLLAEQSPRALLRLFGHAPLTEGTRVSPVERELVMSIKSVDHAFLVEDEEGRCWLEHFEAESSLSAQDLRLIGRRAMLLAIKHDVPVWTNIVLVARLRMPAEGLAEEISEEWSGARLVVRPRYAKLWELQPGVVLTECPVEALPLVGGMKATREELRAALDRLSQVEDGELRQRLFGELAVWSSLNYNEVEIEEIRARTGMTFKDLMLLSPIGEEIAREKEAKGREEGREKGREEGKLRMARENTLAIADSRFPGLLDPNRIENCTDLDKLTQLLRAVALAPDHAAAAAAVRDAFGE